MTTTTTITIIRHAEKESGDFFNPHIGHQDQPISAQGCQQAERLAAYLCRRQPLVTAIYISGYQRTGQTIQPLAERLGLQPVLDLRLNEIDTGYSDNMPDEEVQEKFPDVWRAYTERNADFRFPGGETGAEAQQRIRDFVEEKRCEHGNEAHIVAVCHEGLIRLLMCSIAGLPPFKRGNFYVDFCGMMQIAYQPKWDAWKLMRFNHTCE